MPELAVEITRDEYRQFFLEARRGDTRVGYAEGYEHSPDTIFIKWLGVEPRYRRHGYGTVMVQKVEQFAIQSGYHSIALQPRDRRSASFWAAMGYQMRQGDQYGYWFRQLEDLDLIPNRPDVGPPLPRQARVFWPGRPQEP